MDPPPLAIYWLKAAMITAPPTGDTFPAPTQPPCRWESSLTMLFSWNKRRYLNTLMTRGKETGAGSVPLIKTHTQPYRQAVHAATARDMGEGGWATRGHLLRGCGACRAREIQLHPIRSTAHELCLEPAMLNSIHKTIFMCVCLCVLDKYMLLFIIKH